MRPTCGRYSHGWQENADMRILDEKVGVCPLCYRSTNYKAFRDGRLKYELIRSHVLLWGEGVNFNQDLRFWDITNKTSYLSAFPVSAG